MRRFLRFLCVCGLLFSSPALAETPEECLTRVTKEYDDRWTGSIKRLQELGDMLWKAIERRKLTFKESDVDAYIAWLEYRLDIGSDNSFEKSPAYKAYLTPREDELAIELEYDELKQALAGAHDAHQANLEKCSTP